MASKYKILFICYMTLALSFGFMEMFIAKGAYSFERLHIFLFNLCSGGTILIYFTEGKNRISLKALGFLTLATIYALLAFFNLYIPAIIISVVLAGIIESARIEKFSLFPHGFFKKDEPVSLKFHQASLLCLSLGLIISSLVVLNNEYLKLIDMPKLQLNTFFLGFSFPLSLITMSVIFSLMEEKVSNSVLILKNFGFWSVNLGVIIFFLYIIFEKLLPQVFVTLILFFTVVMIFFLYYKYGFKKQQKNFLASGIAFLIFTAVTGILYIFIELTPGYSSEKYRWLLRLHAFASLYGWNLCGLATIIRFNDFPLNLHSGKVILFHWITVIILAPLGTIYKPFSIITVLCYFLILYVVLFSMGTPAATTKSPSEN